MLTIVKQQNGCLRNQMFGSKGHMSTKLSIFSFNKKCKSNKKIFRCSKSAEKNTCSTGQGAEIFTGSNREV